MNMMNRLMIGCMLLLGLQLNAQDNIYDASRRNFINQFLETYKEAYSRQDIDYISDVFSEDAIVITETEVKRIKNEFRPSSTDGVQITVLNKNEYKRTIESKTEYLKRLSRVFKDNVKIRLSIANINVYSHVDNDKKDIYGLSFLQHWKAEDDSSLNVEDDMPGYVFMMFDFMNGNDIPIVHVRTWQPQHHIREPKDIYGLYDFLIL